MLHEMCDTRGGLQDPNVNDVCATSVVSVLVSLAAVQNKREVAAAAIATGEGARASVVDEDTQINLVADVDLSSSSHRFFFL